MGYVPTRRQRSIKRPYRKWGFCSACQKNEGFTLGTHHSGEQLYRSDCRAIWSNNPPRIA